MANGAGSDSTTSGGDVTLIVVGGPGVSASCARLFSDAWMRVAVAVAACVLWLCFLLVMLFIRQSEWPI